MQKRNSQPDTVRVALYTRVSTDNQLRSDEGSLETQEARLRSAVDSRGPGNRIVRVHREEGASGKNLDRPELGRLVRGIEAGEIDLVMVTRLDRLSRSLLDFLELHKLFEAHGVEMLSLNESFDTTSYFGRAMLKILLVFAELEREQTADRTRVALAARAERGLWNGGHPLLGYDSDGSGHLTVNESEAAVVRVAFDKMLELRAIRPTMRWLNQQGYRQKRYSSRRLGDVGAREFTYAVVNKLLRNRLYLGEIVHKEKVFPGQHEAIVDRVSFDRVRQAITENARGGKPATPQREHEYLLTGVARCGCCGSAMTSSTARGRGGHRYFYYRSVSTTKKGKDACQVRQVKAEQLEEAVLAVVREAASNPALIAEAVAEANRIAAEEIGPSRERLAGLREEFDKAKRQSELLLDRLLSSGASQLQVAKDRLSELDDRLRQLERAIAEEEGRLAVSETRSLDLEAVQRTLHDFDTVFEHLTPAERKEFLQEMVDQVLVHADRIEIALYDGSRARVGLEQARKRPRKVRSDHAGHAGGHAGEGAARTGPGQNDTARTAKGL
jgi:DNA invertase Pin-like site-specific DNA recombinase